MIIKVSQEDIDKGTRCTISLCPIALAFKRHGFTEIFVDHIRYSLVSTKGILYSYYHRIPEVVEFIYAFDDGDLERAKPFEFEIPVSE